MVKFEVRSGGRWTILNRLYSLLGILKRELILIPRTQVIFKK